MNERYSSGLRLFAVAIAAAAALAASGCSKSPPAAQSGGAPGQAGSGQAGQYQGQGGQPGQGQGAPGQARQGGGGRRAAVVPVQAIKVQVGLLSVDRSTAGVITPVTQSQVATQVAGVVLRVPRLAGDWVKAGDIVVQLDDSQSKLSLANAQAALENAKINLAIGQDNSSQANPKLALQVQSAQSAYDSAKKFYDSQKALFDLGGISASQLDTASSQLTAAQANLEGAKTALDQNGKADDQTIAQLKLAVTQAQNQVTQAQLNLQYASIRAPFGGQLAAINMQPGMYVGLNTPVFVLVSAERQVTFNVPPNDATSLRVGTPLKFAFEGKEYPIKVRQAPSAPISGVVPMVATSGGISLVYGSVGDVVYRIPLAQGALIPMAALATLENQNFVFAIENNRAVPKNVTIIAEGGTTAAVSGVAEGDIVIMSPPPGLIQGSQVLPTMIEGYAQGGATVAAAVAAPGSAPQAAGGAPAGGPGQATQQRAARGANGGANGARPQGARATTSQAGTP